MENVTNSESQEPPDKEAPHSAQTSTECELQALQFIALSRQDRDQVTKISYLNADENLTAIKEEVLGPIFNSKFYSNASNPAAAWRLRVKKQTAIDNELRKIGPLSLLTCGSILTTYQFGSVVTLERFSNSITTLTQSVIYTQLSVESRLGLIKMEKSEYDRLELAFQSFSQMFCLSASQQGKREFLEAFHELKLWFISKACFPIGKQNCIRAVDTAISYIKWLAKSCQSVFLKGKIPDRPCLGPTKNGMILPFVSQYKFVSDLIISGKRRTDKLTSHEARFLAQMANTNRALPYPSEQQIVASMDKTVGVFTSRFRPLESDKKRYALGLQIVENRLGPNRQQRTHVSLVSKGSVETPRSKGGRAAFLVANARLAANVPLIDEHKIFVGRFDQFGKELITPASWAMSEILRNREYKRSPTLGDLLYLQVEDIEAQWETSLNEGNSVPKHLADLLNVIAARLILKIGDYDFPYSINYGILNFSVTNVKFKVTKKISVAADASIEAGMKTRLITKCLAAFAHLSQGPSNLMRDYLSKDPFCRVGFEESDKLWEVLKTYKKEFPSD